MISKATVIKKLDNNLAEIEVMRESACGSNCASCAGCEKPSITVRAVAINNISAEVGDVVNVRGNTGFVLKGASFVYVMPLILFLLGYFIAQNFGAIETICIIIGTIFFGIGIYFAGVYSKKLEKENEMNLEIF